MRSPPSPHIARAVAGGVALTPALLWFVSTSTPVSWRGFALVCGFAAAGLFAVSMLLMLRLTVLDRAFGGLGHVYEVHHELGVGAFLLLLMHPLAVAVDALLRRPAEALSLLWPDPSSGAVLSGWVTLILFVGFFVFTVAAQTPYGRWRGVHRASGLAYGAMVWHLVASHSNSAASALLLGLVGAGVLAFAHRLLATDPPRRGLPYQVVDVRHRGPNVLDIVLEPQSEALRFDAGQFVYLALRDSPQYRTCGEVHPYTLTGRPDDPRLHLSIKALGDCTRHIQEVAIGTDAIVQGPFGGLFPRSAAGHPQVWIAGGVGITPFLGRAGVVPSDGPPVDIIYAANAASDALYLDDLLALAATRPNLRVHTMFADTDGLPSVDAVEARVGALDGRDVMLAGPPAMVRSLTEQLRARGVAPSRIHSEAGVLR